MSAAAFFDLDKTLMEGSSALHFARAGYRAGMLSRRQLIRDAWANRRLAICARSFKALPKPAQQLVEHLRRSAR